MNVQDMHAMEAESRRETARLALVQRVAALEAAIRSAVAVLQLSSHPHCRDACEILERVELGE